MPSAIMHALCRVSKLLGVDAGPGASGQADTPFRDIWVARDARGNLFQHHTPWISSPEARLRIAAGLPAPVQCCWNGLAVFDATPFTQGLRIRAHQPRECAASECQLMCNDFHRLGLRRVVLDPAVRLAYTQAAALQVRILNLQLHAWVLFSHRHCLASALTSAGNVQRARRFVARILPTDNAYSCLAQKPCRIWIRGAVHRSSGC
jgi:Cryptococcal mannosyltransferase 1